MEVYRLRSNEAVLRGSRGLVSHFGDWYNRKQVMKGDPRMIGYRTQLGECWCRDSREALAELPSNSIDLILTSPPFSLQRKKRYSNFIEKSQDQYVNWLLEFFRIAYDKIKETGSIVIDLGGAYEQGRAVRSLYQYEFIIRMCKELHYNLLQDIYYVNRSALPLPIQYVNKEHKRLKSSVNLELWYGKSDKVKADNRKVLTEYSDKMQEFLDNKEKFISSSSDTKPSGNIINKNTWKRNKGAIHSNALIFSNADGSSKYMKTCRDIDVDIHPARMPIQLADFFIQFLTDEGDLVVDIFSGSGTVLQSAEQLNRRWIGFDISPEYVASSSFRFENNDGAVMKNYQQYKNILNGKQCILGCG